MDMKKHEPRQIVHDFLVAKQAEGKTEAAVKFYRENLGRILWWFDVFNMVQFVEEITPTHIRELLVYIRTTSNRWAIGSASSRKPASKSTVDAYWRTMQSLFAWLVREEIIDTKLNPMKKIPRPDVAHKVIQDIPLSLIKKAIVNCGSSAFTAARNKAIILVFLDAGVRLGGCASMTILDTNLETGLAKVWEKGEKQLTIHLNETALKALKEYLNLRKYFSNNSLWLKEDGTIFTKSAIQSMIRRLRRFGGGVRWTPHTFRNTWAINLLRAGADTFTLQTLGGWTDLERPRRYTQAMKIEDAIRVHKRTSPADRMENENS